jgi:signal transduction histidine kinase
MRRGAEVLLAFGAAATSFAAVSALLVAVDAMVLVVVLGAVCIAAVGALYRLCGIGYAAPVALAVLVAFDWFQLPPTHPHDFPGSDDLADLLAYLVFGVAIGEAAAYAVRRGSASEAARAELVVDQLAGQVRSSGAVVCIEDQLAAGAPPIPATARHVEMRSSIGAPIVVEGRVWGAVLAWSRRRRRFPAQVEARLSAFTELIAVAILNTASREALTRLVDEQAALQRVATLVASGVPRQELFEAVAREAGQLIGVDAAHLLRYDADSSATTVASWTRTGEPAAIGARFDLDGKSVLGAVFRTQRPARIGSYERLTGMVAATARSIDIWSSVGAPIMVEGRLWGVLIVSSKQDATLPPETEDRTAAFTELIATAIANSQARLELEQLVDEQAALRRVATLVASEPSSAEVFRTVADSVRRLLGVEITRMYRYEEDGTATVLADWSEAGPAIGVGTNVTLEGDNVVGKILRTGRPARVDDQREAAGTLARLARESGARSAVGAPISIGGRLWGAVVAATRRVEPLPAETEARISQFTELVGTAVSNTQTRSELAESRARIAAAGDAERRRVVRDLHDGAQQRLVHTVITLKLARQAVVDAAGDENAPGPLLVSEALGHAERAMVELRELAHGIMPDVLTHGGLRAGVESLASRTPMPVDVRVSVGRLPPDIEATAYFVVAEALTNVAKHSRAAGVAVMASVKDDRLCVRVRDDGEGGARAEGSGLTGLGDRLAIHHGRLRIESPAHGGTLVEAVIPLGDGGRHAA